MVDLPTKMAFDGHQSDGESTINSRRSGFEDSTPGSESTLLEFPVHVELFPYSSSAENSVLKVELPPNRRHQRDDGSVLLYWGSWVEYEELKEGLFSKIPAKYRHWHCFYSDRGKSYRYLKKQGYRPRWAIRPGSTLKLYECIVFLQFPIEGKQERFRMGVTQFESVREFKKRIRMRKRLRMPSLRIRQLVLLHDGQELQDDQLIGSYSSIVHGSIIDIIRLVPTARICSIVQKLGTGIAFQTCTRIPRVEHRGITLSQLSQVAMQIHLRCIPEKWTSTNPARKGEQLQPHEVTLYDLVEYYIKPTTRELNCSYVEAVAEDDQQIGRYMVSHWWGEPVFRMISCLNRHSRDRNLGRDTPYWICAYALCQHDVSGELGTSPQDSPFFKAMTIAEGAVSVLDEQCVCYNRVWCAYEVSLALKDLVRVKAEKGGNYLYDVYSINEQGLAVGLTDGLAQIDTGKKGNTKYAPDTDESSCSDDSTDSSSDDSSSEDEGAAARRQRLHETQKESRQKCFPLEVSAKALNVKIEKAEASRREDRKSILHCVCGRNHDSPDDPPATHEAYENVNNLLRGKFAASTYRLALEQGLDMQPFRTALANSPLTSVVASFRRCHCAGVIKEAQHFAASIPLTVENLKLDYANVGFSSSDEFALGLGRLQQLKSFTLYFRHGEHWTGHSASEDACTDIKSLWSELGRLPLLESVTMDLSQNCRLEAADGLADWLLLEERVHLTTLDLSMSSCALPDKTVLQVFRSLMLLYESRNTSNPLSLRLYFGKHPLAVALFMKYSRLNDFVWSESYRYIKTLDELDESVTSGQTAERLVNLRVDDALDEREFLLYNLEVRRHNSGGGDPSEELLEEREKSFAFRKRFEARYRPELERLRKDVSDPVQHVCEVALIDFKAMLVSFLSEEGQDEEP
ncbi:expressed unknown protein [Seminavis robusta]|uniref:Ubiquitin-like domain-containing protein n=1 Tax=Seminavis robusta TaxID=568900 RepID=A0A9N8EV28_9STRA|nr:expressed unknown protein [Seminavis robusta]|eukprot:Sro1765_g296190.1 n/a (914) ;mRNA; r:14002-16743